MKSPSGAEVAARVPLRPVACAVLAALADGPQAGIDILEAVNATVPGANILGPGTLYRLLRDMRHEGLIARAEATALGDERQVPHLLTSLGAAVLDAEVRRLKRTITMAARARLAER